MTYDPRLDLQACTEGTVEVQIRTSTVSGWLKTEDQLVLDAQGGRFQTETPNIVFDYPTHLLPFRPTGQDFLLFANQKYSIDKTYVEGGSLMTKLFLGNPINV